jgi:colanic acid/amylovoran biosynthesis glycosyltransferase
MSDIAIRVDNLSKLYQIGARQERHDTLRDTLMPDARLVMIGDGPLLDASKRLAQAMHIDYTVDFRGAQPHQDVASTMQRVRAFVQHSLRPSDGDSEGTPVAILEASASGLPVISTRHAGIPDVVIGGETGILVDESNVDSMAQAMIRIAQDPQLAMQMGQAGRRRIENAFSMEKSIDNLWEIIASVIEEPKVKNATR